jgi:hypothetical protein
MDRTGAQEPNAGLRRATRGGGVEIGLEALISEEYFDGLRHGMAGAPIAAVAPSDFRPDQSVLVVVEGSAATLSWPSHLGAPPEHGWSLLEQEEWEPAHAFRARVNDALERCTVDSTSNQVVLFVAGSWMDGETLAARDRLANDILRQLAQAQGGTFLLSHGHLQDGRLRGELETLASELAEEWDDPRLVVRTRFARPSWLPEPRRPADMTRGYMPEPGRLLATA